MWRHFRAMKPERNIKNNTEVRTLRPCSKLHGSQYRRPRLKIASKLANLHEINESMRGKNVLFFFEQVLVSAKNRTPQFNK